MPIIFVDIIFPQDGIFQLNSPLNINGDKNPNGISIVNLYNKIFYDYTEFWNRIKRISIQI